MNFFRFTLLCFFSFTTDVEAADAAKLHGYTPPRTPPKVRPLLDMQPPADVDPLPFDVDPFQLPFDVNKQNDDPTSAGLLKEIIFPEPDGNGTRTYKLNNVIGRGQFGTVYATISYDPIHDSTGKYAAKVMCKDNDDTKMDYDISCVLQALAERQKYGEKSVQNLVRIEQTTVRKTNTLKNEYIVIMKRYDGTLEDLVKNQLPLTTITIDDELRAMHFTVNILGQLVTAFEQLQGLLGPEVHYNDWNLGNVLLETVRFDMSRPVDAVCVLSDFGKVRNQESVGTLGTAVYHSSVTDPLADETQDLSQIAVIGMHLLSAFGCKENAIWRVFTKDAKRIPTGFLRHARVAAMRKTLMSALIRQSHKAGGRIFNNKSVMWFFVQLANASWDKALTFGKFKLILENAAYVHSKGIEMPRQPTFIHKQLKRKGKLKRKEKK